MKKKQQQPVAAPPKPMVSSSPGRAEKLPAPGLARLLRGKSGSRSSGARSSPMFVSRNKSINHSSSSALAGDGEPSSPKVTCIGQVRIRNRNKNAKASAKPNRSELPSTSRCRCLERTLLCNFFTIKKKKASRPYRFFCWRTQKKVTEATEASPIAFVREMKIDSSSEEEEEAEDEETKVFVSSSSADASATTHSPPKNALLLMRCRSAPHNRSSALSLCRFPVSPVPASESEGEEEVREGIDERGREPCNVSSKDDEEEESRWSSSISQQPAGPAGLMRCKSEPAKKAEKLMEVSSCKWNGSEGGGSGEGGVGVGVGVVQEVGPTHSPPPILLH